MKTNTPCPHPSIVMLEQGDKIITQCTMCGKKMNVVKKPSCSCYGGFDCEVCNPDYYEEQRKNGTPWTEPDHNEQHLEMVPTPRTDAAEPQLHSNLGGWVRADFARGLELELTHSLQNQMKSQSEVKSLTEKLTSLQEAYLQSVERDNSLTKELFDSRAEIESLSKLTEDCLNVIRVYCPIYYNDAMDRFKTINKCTH